MPTTQPRIITSRDIEVKEFLGGGVCGAEKVTIAGNQYVMKRGEFGDFEACEREHLAYRVSAALGFTFIPESFFCRDENFEMFSVQRFLSGFKTWSMTPIEWKHKMDERKLTSMLLLDYLIYNSDRHGGNFMVNESGEFTAIDNGFTFRCDKVDWPSGICYSDMANQELPIAEFVYRINRADLEFMRDTEYADGFFARAFYAAKYSHLTVRDLKVRARAF